MAAQPKVNLVVTKPAPIGGLNARDALSAMPEGDAVQLVNWVPDAYGVRTRKGFRAWAEGLGAPVRSLISWFGPSTTYSAAFLSNPTAMPGKLFAATDAGIYDVTTRGAAPTLAQALSNTANAGWLSTAMLTNTAGAFLLVASEVDGYYHYNGTTWVKPIQGSGVGEVHHVNPALFQHVLVWKRRAWFVEKSSTRAWYLPTDSITGNATSIDFGPLMTNGGHLSYLAKWTIDAGEGIDDFLVAVGSNGDVMVYKGTDPSSVTTFSLVGTWFVGQIPVGRRAVCQYGGDLIIVSAEGVFPMSYVTRGGAALLQASSKEYTSKIRARIGPVLRSTFTSRGWDLVLHPSERLLMLNVPDTKGYRNAQFAMNTTLNEWCILQDIPTTCYAMSGGYLLSGTAAGTVQLLFTSFLDNVPLTDVGGDGIYGIILPAFNQFQSPALEKQFLMLRPHFLAQGIPGVVANITVNYAVSPVQIYPNYATQTAARFDTARFDSSRWGSDAGAPFAEWVGVGGVGSAGAALLYTACAGDTVLSAIDYMYSVGGPL